MQAAAGAFGTLFKTSGPGSGLETVVPTLLQQLEGSPQQSEQVII